jgi:nucleoside-diphosphate-sugar epimerase
MIRHFQFGDDFKIFGDGNQTRDYVYVEDVAQAVGMATVLKPGTYNIATGKRLSVNDVGRALCEIYELPAQYPWEHRAEPDPRKDICLNVRSAAEHLGWEPRVSFKEGLRRTVQWWEKPPERPQPVKVAIGYEVVR